MPNVWTRDEPAGMFMVSCPRADSVVVTIKANRTFVYFSRYICRLLLAGIYICLAVPGQQITHANHGSSNTSPAPAKASRRVARPRAITGFNKLRYADRRLCWLAAALQKAAGLTRSNVGAELRCRV